MFLFFFVKLFPSFLSKWGGDLDPSCRVWTKVISGVMVQTGSLGTVVQSGTLGSGLGTGVRGPYGIVVRGPGGVPVRQGTSGSEVEMVVWSGQGTCFPGPVGNIEVRGPDGVVVRPGYPGPWSVREHLGRRSGRGYLSGDVWVIGPGKET